MQNLHYVTAANDRHDVRVKTWVERAGDWWAEVTVDGRVLATESLGTDRDYEDER